MAVEALEQNQGDVQQTRQQAKHDLKMQRKRDKKQGKSGKLGLIIILTLLFLIGAAVVIWIFDLFGLREQVFIPFVRNIPIVNNLLPQDQSADPMKSKSQDELIAQISQLETQLEQSKKNESSLTEKNKFFSTELLRLQGIEDQQLQFKSDKEQFDRLVASNDPTAYAKYYEKISPENAEKIYRELIGTVQQSKDLKNYVAAYQSMDETAAAKLLEELVSTDMDLVVLILKNIDVKKTSAILAEMTPQNAARVTKRMAP